MSNSKSSKRTRPQDRRLKVVPVPRKDGPDLERIAKAIVALALQRLTEEQRLDDASPSSPHSSGDAA